MIAINLDLNVREIRENAFQDKPALSDSARVKRVYDEVTRRLKKHGFERVANQGSLYRHKEDKLGPLIAAVLDLRSYCHAEGYNVFQRLGAAKLTDESDITQYLGQVGGLPTNIPETD